MQEISFQCPNCKGSLNVPGEMANQLMECPACKETIEVPIRTREQPPDSTRSPDSAIFIASATGGESTFFQSGDVLVTNARFVVGPKIFAMRSIDSVEVVESDEATEAGYFPAKNLALAIGGAGFIIIIVGALCWLLFDFSFWVAVASGVVGILMFIFSASLITEWKQAFTIVLKTAGGEVTAYKSFDRNHVSQIIRALNESIISHG